VKYKFTLIGLVIALLIGVFSNLFDLDPFDKLVDFFNSVEHYEIDEYFIGGIILLFFIMADLISWQRNQKVELEKVRVYKAMIFSLHHILNNFLNQMQLFQFTAQTTPGFDPKVLKLYDEIIEETTKQVKELSNLKEIDEQAIKESVLPKSSNSA